MYDLIIKGGRVIDPAQKIDDRLDLGVEGETISALGKDLPPSQGTRVIEAAGKIVTPGLIDLHCHVYNHVHDISVAPDDAGVRQGVTTVVDAGSAGQAIFGGFPRYVIPTSRTSVFCFLHLASQGLTLAPELMDWREVDTDAMAATIESHPRLIKGIKLRLMGHLANSEGAKIVEVGKRIAGKFGMPIMVHLGDFEKQVSSTLTEEVLPLMERADILSHVYTAQRGCALRPDGAVIAELRAATRRGVVLDVANGRMNLNYEVARKALCQGVLPTTLSSDVTAPSLGGPVYGLTVTMSRFLALGLELGQVIEMTTVNPARAIAIDDRKGSLRPGMDADISVLALLTGTWELNDAQGNPLEIHTLVEPRMSIKLGQPIDAEPAARPQALN